LVLAAKQMIELRFRENLTPEVIGRELHCNSEYVGRMFKREYGRTITAAVNTMRVEYAAKLLAATSYSVKEIVVMSGFNDPAYFRRCFYKRYALTPVRFRMRWVQGHFNSC
jgi:YesN/AraC family two-component response regulator